MLYTGGAGSCMGCGEGSALRMMLAATGFVYGKESIGLVAATGRWVTIPRLARRLVK